MIKTDIIKLSCDDGVSVIICCYNSANKIAFTLDSIGIQKGLTNVDIEVLLIDNNSKDNTAQVATDHWISIGDPFPFKVYCERKPGLSFARSKGIRKAKYNTIVFVDDDNDLNSDYLLVAHSIIQSNLSIGACGGQTFLPKSYYHTTDLPNWWERHKGALAIGIPKNSNKGLKYIWGAGMCINKKAYTILKNQGFEFILTGRKEEELLAGEDSELCFALQRLNYKVVFNPLLKLTHRIDKSRISEIHVRGLMGGFGKSHVYLNIYKNIYRFGFSAKWLEYIISIFQHLTSLVLIVIPNLSKAEKSFHYNMTKNRLKEIHNLSNVNYKAMTKKIINLNN